MTTPKAHVCNHIDELLSAAGWIVQNRSEMNLGAARGVAMREFPFDTGFVDYMLSIDRKVVGAIEAKSIGTPLTGVESQSAKYGAGLPLMATIYLPIISQVVHR